MNSAPASHAMGQSAPRTKSKVRFKRPTKGEIDLELVFGPVFVACAIIAAIWISFSIPTPACRFKETTGLACFSCGSTRASVALFHGNWESAFWMNPLITAGLIALGMITLYCLVVVIFRLPRLRIQLSRPMAWVVRISVILAVLGNWIYLIAVGR